MLDISFVVPFEDCFIIDSVYTEPTRHDNQLHMLEFLRYKAFGWQEFDLLHAV
jgi:hypothetical protein